MSERKTPARATAHVWCWGNVEGEAGHCSGYVPSRNVNGAVPSSTNNTAKQLPPGPPQMLLVFVAAASSFGVDLQVNRQVGGATRPAGRYSGVEGWFGRNTHSNRSLRSVSYNGQAPVMWAAMAFSSGVEERWTERRCVDSDLSASFRVQAWLRGKDAVDTHRRVWPQRDMGGINKAYWAVILHSSSRLPKASTQHAFFGVGSAPLQLQELRPSCTVVALAVRLLHGNLSANTPWRPCCAALLLFLSIRSRCGRGWASLAAAAPVVTPRTRGEMRPYCNGTSPMARGESPRAAIEMAAERPTGALRGVCTHVRLSSFAWPRHAPGHAARMPPECPGATTAGLLVFAATAAQGQMRPPAAATARWAAIASARYLACAQCERFYEPALPDISMCSGPWAESHAARSGLTLAGAADGGPASHRCCGTARLRQTITCGLRPPSFLFQHVELFHSSGGRQYHRDTWNTFWEDIDPLVQGRRPFLCSAARRPVNPLWRAGYDVKISILTSSSHTLAGVQNKVDLNSTTTQAHPQRRAMSTMPTQTIIHTPASL
ncbi:hypothetical protein SVAN01_01297 [Stagonosporopsis vannaccii]|nr:hypothetical protein SVAN01_01297 [Stagonosporopsis vannaccii]